MACWKLVHFRMFRSTLTVQKLRRLSIQNSTVQNGGRIFGLYSGQFDWRGVNTVSVLIFITLRGNSAGRLHHGFAEEALFSWADGKSTERN